MRNSMRLNPGDKIGLLATARWVEADVIESAAAQIRAWEYEPVTGKHVMDRYHQFGGTNKDRARDLQQMLDDPDIKAIMFLRGGYGCIHVMEYLDFTAFTLRPKWICGFSDFTILHTHINDKLGLPTMHAAMPYSFLTNTPESIARIGALLQGTYAPVSTTAHPLNMQGDASGILIGGNLSILYSLLGTKYGFSTAGKILFIEDLDEYVYHIDRMMMSMKLAGKLDHVKGIIVGGMSDMRDNQIPFGATAEEIISSHTAHLNVPICFDFPAGHISNNLPLAFGTQVHLQVDATGVFLEYV